MQKEPPDFSDGLFWECGFPISKNKEALHDGCAAEIIADSYLATSKLYHLLFILSTTTSSIKIVSLCILKLLWKCAILNMT